MLFHGLDGLRDLSGLLGNSLTWVCLSTLLRALVMFSFWLLSNELCRCVGHVTAGVDGPLDTGFLVLLRLSFLGGGGGPGIGLWLSVEP